MKKFTSLLLCFALLFCLPMGAAADVPEELQALPAAQEQPSFSEPAVTPLTSQSTPNYTWPIGQALPSFGKPVDTLDGMELFFDKTSFEERLTAACLQGIINRTEPRLFMIVEPDPWATDLELNVTVFPEWKDAIVKYRAELSGLVVYNPDIPDTANVATTIAGIKDCLAVSPEMADILRVAPYNLDIVVDLRSEAKITDKLSAYRYLHETYWEQCTRRVVTGLYPKDHTQWRDFAVAVKSAVVWLDPAVPEESEVMQLFFEDSTPIDTYYTGWWPNEAAGVTLASTYGISTIASDFYINSTVYSGMSREITVPAVPAKPKMEDGKIYVALLLSDGDNTQYVQHFMRGDRVWGDRRRGEVPVGYTNTPAMLDVGPQLLNYYYKTATENDVLICGPSGLGYTTTAHWRDKEFTRQYAEITNSYFERTGFNFITFWRGATAQKLDWFAEKCPSLLGSTVQNWWGPRIRFMKTGAPNVWLGSHDYFERGYMSYDQGTANIKEQLTTVANKKTKAPQFQVAQGCAWDTTVSDLAQLAEDMQAEFPDRFVFVRPDHLMMLVNEYYGKPFMTSLRKTAKSTSEAQSFEAANAVDGTFSTGWQAAAPGKAELIIDLGEEFSLRRYVLKNAETNYLDSSLNTKAWQLFISCDGEKWKSIDAVEDNGEAIVYRNLKNQKARYVKLTVENPGSDGIARIQELEVFGSKAKGFTAFFYTCFERISGFIMTYVNVIAERFFRDEGSQGII